MSLNNDICDFCGAWVDPIGGDLAVATWYRYGLIIDIPENELWCGGCKNGQAMIDYYDSKLDMYLAVQEFKYELRKVIEWLLRRLPARLVGRNGNEK